MSKDEAIKMAIDALKEPLGFTGSREIDTKLRLTIKTLEEALANHIPDATKMIKQEQGEPVGEMTPRRAEMFMTRFKHEEKMLGPNEQAALDYVIAMLVAKQEQGEPVAKAWAEGYRMGIADERTSEANIGIAGFNAKVEPDRQNPYGIPQPKQEQGEPVAATDSQISYEAHIEDPEDWNDLNFKECWHKGFADGFRAAEVFHKIGVDK